jgi:hypothetical protein
MASLQSIQSISALNQEVMLLEIEVADAQEIGIHKPRCMMLHVLNVEIHVRFHLSQDKEGLFFVVIALDKQNLEMTDTKEMIDAQEMADAQEIGMQQARCMMLLVRNVELHVRFHLNQDKEEMFFVVIALEQQNLEITDVLVVELQEEIEKKKLVMILLEKRKTTLKAVQIRFMQTCEKNYLRF